MKGFQIAIDGPVAAGKSSVSRAVAERLGYLYVDTGAMYRAVTLMAFTKGVSVKNEEAMAKLVDKMKLEVRLPNEDEQDGRQSTVLLNGEDVSHKIRRGRVNKWVPVAASLMKLRKALVPVQKKVAKGKNVVMEGRDITYVILPKADLRIYMDASMEVRIDRYFKSRSEKKKGISREEAARWLRDRDKTDRNREASPLKIVPGVWFLDTSEMSFDEVVDEIAKRVEKK